MNNRPTYEDVKFEIKTTEMHTAGDPVRIIESGYPKIYGDTFLEKREYVMKELDLYRSVVMEEPRGHSNMYGALLVPPDTEEAAMGVIYLNNEGYLMACGHITISVSRYLIDRGYVKAVTSPETEVKIQCPSGMVTALVEYKDGKTGYAKFRNVPSYVCIHKTVYVEEFGEIPIDLCFGGSYYAVVSATHLGYHMPEVKLSLLEKSATDVLRACRRQIVYKHGLDPRQTADIKIWGVMMTEEKEDRTYVLCVAGDEQLCRSPCGSGSTAVMALQHSLGIVRRNQPRIYESVVTNTEFVGEIVEEHEDGDTPRVTAQVKGYGHYTGSSIFSYSGDDKLGKGFII